MLDITIVRHGQSVADIEGRMEGRADFPLTDLGRGQANKLAVWLKNNIKIDTIISSPLKRASETAEIISELYAKEPSFDDRLMEWNNGKLAGMLRDEADQKYPIPEGGRRCYQRLYYSESTIDLRTRAESFIAELVDTYDVGGADRSILVVAHGGIISMMLQSFLGLPIRNGVGIASSDTAVHRIRVTGDSVIVLNLNQTVHLLD